MWNAEAIHYRHANGFDHFDAAMAVVVQQLVPSEASGVLFSVNPVTSDLTEIVVNAGFGLGEGVVDGSVEVDSFVLDRETGSIVRRSVSPKTRLVAYADGSGTQQLSVPSERQNQPVLTDAQLSELYDLALSVEEVYETPHDIEWGHDGDRFHVLQARPITGLDRFPMKWANEEDKQHTRISPPQREARPVLPLDELRDSMFYVARMEGFSRIGGGPLANAHVMFNAYPFEGVVPIDAPPEELARRREAFQAKLAAA